jgi:hypothetical protein
VKIIRNAGSERVLDHARAGVKAGGKLDIATERLSLFAYAELADILATLSETRVILPDEKVGLAKTFEALAIIKYQVGRVMQILGMLFLQHKLQRGQTNQP